MFLSIFIFNMKIHRWKESDDRFEVLKNYFIDDMLPHKLTPKFAYAF